MDTSDKIKEMKFKNPHWNISNEIENPSNISNKSSLSSLNISNIDSKVLQKDRMNISSSENKYIKMKRQSNLSSSTSSLMRHYKASNVLNNSGNTTSVNYLPKKSGIM